MIKNFGSSETAALFVGQSSRYLPADIQRVALRKLVMIHAAMTLQDLRVPPANHLEQLRGKLKGLYSIRINRQWRIQFRWDQGQAYQVEIVDYH